MQSISMTQKILSVYANKEQWETAHDEAQSCSDLEEKLAWGLKLFQTLQDQEVRLQSNAPQALSAEVQKVLEDMPRLYQLWLVASETYLGMAQDFQTKGYMVDEIKTFAETVEEVRWICESMALEEEILPFEQLRQLARPDNPRPDRYGL